ncbi:lycopene cyclase domain-containing protein [Brumimicrobium aurantiacum]|uniref:Lycopene cyclase domain-containing protein n=1 Tax=Brumimicrobium aurantiacum TaxID=1737063 RepID=A0A3E1F228_9FLAO|nr:lycopene cyclase domain-containing protein [Brumimicrobium aurantiacum]RFC55855.1 lycopene cyclase domain-containing protein [Brumimicrobium aurantiacum]
MSLYLWINILSIAGPLLLSFDKKVHFYSHWKTLFPSILVIGSLFIAWDIYFTDIGVWGFNEEYLSGYYFFNLPIEECLFFFTIPYACVFIYEVVKAYFPNFKPVRFSYYFSLIFTVFCIVMSILYSGNWYTFVALLGAGILNWIVYFGFTPKWYSSFIVAFLITQIPFLIVNGILTGVATDHPVVWYNENEIIDFRILSIPIEDVFYNFFMLFSIVIVHEYLRSLWDIKTKNT